MNYDEKVNEFNRQNQNKRPINIKVSQHFYGNRSIQNERDTSYIGVDGKRHQISLEGAADLTKGIMEFGKFVLGKTIEARLGNAITSDKLLLHGDTDDIEVVAKNEIDDNNVIDVEIVTDDTGETILKPISPEKEITYIPFNVIIDGKVRLYKHSSIREFVKYRNKHLKAIPEKYLCIVEDSASRDDVCVYLYSRIDLLQPNPECKNEKKIFMVNNMDINAPFINKLYIYLKEHFGKIKKSDLLTMFIMVTEGKNVNIVYKAVISKSGNFIKAVIK